MPSGCFLPPTDSLSPPYFLQTTLNTFIYLKVNLNYTMVQINLIPIWLSRIIFEKKLKWPVFLRNILSFIFAILFYVLLIISINYFSSNRIYLGLLFILLSYLSLILYNWFKLSYKELILNSFKNIDELKIKNKHEKIIDEVDSIVQQINSVSDEEDNTFTINILERLGEYVSLFVYPILLSMDSRTRNLIYSELFVKLKRIFKNKNKFYEIPRLLEQFDNSFLRKQGVKKSLALFYEKDNSFFNQHITRKIIELRKEVKEKQKGVFEKIWELIKENQIISAPIILVILYLVVKYLLDIEIPI